MLQIKAELSGKCSEMSSNRKRPKHYKKKEVDGRTRDAKSKKQRVEQTDVDDRTQPQRHGEERESSSSSSSEEEEEEDEIDKIPATMRASSSPPMRAPGSSSSALTRASGSSSSALTRTSGSSSSALPRQSVSSSSSALTRQSVSSSSAIVGTRRSASLSGGAPLVAAADKAGKKGVK